VDAGFPRLEVISPHAGAARRGEQVALVDGLTVGRSPKSGVALASGLLAPLHARFEFRFGRWWVFDVGSANGVRKNGEAVRDAEVESGDVVEFPDGAAFRVWLAPPPPDSPALERAVLDDLDDDARWLVWGDWLIENGNPTGRRVAGEAGDAEDDARALGSLGAAWRDGWLDVDFHRGFPRRVVVRGPTPVSPMGETPALLVQRVLEEPACRFLRHLEVDPASFGTGLRAANDVDQLLALLAAAPWTVPLESVRVGPVGLAVRPEAVAKAWAAVRERLPRLVTPAERLLFSAGQATLEVVAAPAGVAARPGPGRSIGLSGTHPNFIGQLDECAVQVSAGDEHPASRLALRVEDDGARWFVEDIAGLARGRRAWGPALRVNGRERPYAHLRDGDVLEPMDGLRLRFRLR
jgi:uncharacterized protein (TIGR02996 family)